MSRIEKRVCDEKSFIYHHCSNLRYFRRYRYCNACLPTTPFLLLATYLFSRSSPKMHKLLLENRVFGKYLSNYFNNKPIPVLQKTISIFFVWLGLGLTFYFTYLPSWLIVLLILIGIAVSIHIFTLERFRQKSNLM